MIIANPKRLAMLARVLQRAYEEAKDSAQMRDADGVEVKERLARLILEAYSEGETDPRLLKRIALLRLLGRVEPLIRI